MENNFSLPETFVIGDIHGCYDQLENLLHQIQTIIDNRNPHQVIFLGDYIDRGLKSKEVLDLLIRVRNIWNCFFLRGNHEQMFIDYFESNGVNSSNFLNGGQSTFSSLNLKQYIANPSIENVSPIYWDFINDTKFYFEEKDFICVHAGLNPSINNVEGQDIKDLIWIRHQFFTANKRWDKKIIFGHTVTNHIHPEGIFEPYYDIERNILALDTGAVYGGKLTCYYVNKNKFLFAY